MKYSSVKKLYKYKPINKDFVETLREYSIYAPVISQLNDPFESSLYINDYEIEKNFYNKILNEIDSKYNQKSKQKNKEYINELINNYKIDIINDIKSKKDREILFSKIAENVGVVSFSAENDILLLWSHYANAHKGICLEFARTSSSVLGDDKKCFPIQYSSFIKDIDMTLIKENIPYEYFKYKSDIWDYEKEWRLIVNKGETSIKFPGELTNVYFGLKTSNKDIDTIINILGENINYSKADKVVNMYKIRFTRIT